MVFLDASVQEEAACPDRIHLFFTGSGRICGIRLEGGEGLATGRIPTLLEVSSHRPSVSTYISWGIEADIGAGGQADSGGTIEVAKRPNTKMTTRCVRSTIHILNLKISLQT